MRAGFYPGNQRGLGDMENRDPIIIIACRIFNSAARPGGDMPHEGRQLFKVTKRIVLSSRYNESK